MIRGSQARAKKEDEEERREVMKEANESYDVKKIIPTIYLVSELSRSRS